MDVIHFQTGIADSWACIHHNSVVAALRVASSDTVITWDHAMLWVQQVHIHQWQQQQGQKQPMFMSVMHVIGSCNFSPAAM